MDQGYSEENFERAVRQMCCERVRKEVIKRETQGFKVLPKCWVVERCYGLLNRYRRLGKDDERYPETSEAMIYGCSIRLLMLRLGALVSV